MVPGPISVDVIAKWIFGFVASWPVLGYLLWLIVADIILGVLAASVMKRVNSTASFAGITKKVATLIAVGVCAIIGKLASMPLAELACVGYIGTEVLSIVEKLAICGVKFPALMMDILEKVRASKVPEPLRSAPSVSVTHADVVIGSRSDKIDPATLKSAVTLPPEPPKES